MREGVAPLLTSEVPSLTLAVWTSQKATHSIPPHMTSGTPIAHLQIYLMMS